MPQISSSADVYKKLVEESDENWLLGLLAFAIVEEQRIEWMKHFLENNGGPATTADIQHWYEQQPTGVLLRAKGDAENTLQAYADDVLQEVLEVERRDVAEGVIVSEIRIGRRFWPQFGINVVAGLASATLFAAILTIIAFIVLQDVSPVTFSKEMRGHQTEGATSGKAIGKPEGNQ
jgi:hypothetical protein